MSLQNANSATTASNAAVIQASAALTSLTMTTIDNAITVASQRTDLDERTYKITLDFDADINGRTKPIEIIQPDSSRILIKDLVSQLIDKGYRASHKEFKTREGKNDKLKLQIAWGAL